jgi:hypothetical protein
VGKINIVAVASNADMHLSVHPGALLKEQAHSKEKKITLPLPIEEL